MTVQTAKFVDASWVFEGCATVWKEFNQLDLPFSFGDNNRSLVTAGRITDQLDCLDTEDHLQLVRVLSRLKDIPDDVYVDLES